MMFMIRRIWWEKLIAENLRRRPIVWLAGVRRSGKTVLCRSMEGARYFDCELPSVRRAQADPESIFKAQGAGLLILDEVH